MHAPLRPQPQLDVSFLHHPDHGTYLDRRVFRWPYTISRTFRRDRVPEGMLTLIIQSVSGAIQADDVLAQRYHVGSCAAVHITTPGAAPVYRAPPGLEARDDVELVVEDRGYLEYLPEPRILFQDSCLSQRVRLRLALGGTAVLSDAFALRRPEPGGMFRRYASEISIESPDGRLLALERIDLDDFTARSGRREAFSAFGSLIVATSSCDRLAPMRADVALRTQGIDGLYLSVTRLPNNAGVALRAAGHDGRRLRQGLVSGWHVARKLLFGAEPIPFAK